MDDHRFLILMGGKGSGKSEFVGRKIFYRCIREGGHNFLILRKERTWLRDSCMKVMSQILTENKIAFDFNETRREYTFTSPTGKMNRLHFDGLDEPEKVKSIVGITGVWMEEMTDFDQLDFRQINLQFRGATEHYKQIIGSFNPDEAKGRWIKEKWFDASGHPRTDMPKVRVDVSTVDDNPFLDEESREQLDEIDDPTYYKIYRLGEWAMSKGVIYHNWDIWNGPWPTYADDTIYGVDFGWNNQSAILEIMVRDQEVFLRQLVYRSHITNSQLIDLAKIEIPDWQKAFIYCDTAEPDRINEFQTAGFLYAQASDKEIHTGIDFCKRFKLHVHPNSLNLIDEFKSYKWKETKSGGITDEPFKYHDHLMSCLRYGLYTHLGKGESFAIAQGDADFY